MLTNSSALHPENNRTVVKNSENLLSGVENGPICTDWMCGTSSILCITQIIYCLATPYDFDLRFIWSITLREHISGILLPKFSKLQLRVARADNAPVQAREVKNTAPRSSQFPYKIIKLGRTSRLPLSNLVRFSLSVKTLSPPFALEM